MRRKGEDEGEGEGEKDNLYKITWGVTNDYE